MGNTASGAAEAPDFLQGLSLDVALGSDGPGVDRSPSASARREEKSGGDAGASKPEDFDSLDAALCLTRCHDADAAEAFSDHLRRRLAPFATAPEPFAVELQQRIDVVRRYLRKEALARDETPLLREAEDEADSLVPAGAGDADGADKGLPHEVEFALHMLCRMFKIAKRGHLGPRQALDFLEQIAPLLSSLQPRSLGPGAVPRSRAARHQEAIRSAQAVERIPDDAAAARRRVTERVLNEARDFVVQGLVMPSEAGPAERKNDKAAARTSSGSAVAGGDLRSPGKHVAWDPTEARRRTLSMRALLGIAAARGRTSDLLLLVKVLLDMQAIGASSEDADQDAADAIADASESELFIESIVEREEEAERARKANVARKLLRHRHSGNDLPIPALGTKVARPGDLAKSRRRHAAQLVLDGSDHDGGLPEDEADLEALHFCPADGPAAGDEVCWSGDAVASATGPVAAGPAAGPAEAGPAETGPAETGPAEASPDPSPLPLDDAERPTSGPRLKEWRRGKQDATKSPPPRAKRRRPRIWDLRERDVAPFLDFLGQAEPANARERRAVPANQLSGGETEVWSCGQNSYGELGLLDTANRKGFSRVRLAADAVDVAAGNEHTVVLGADGRVYTVGYNDNGQCGTGTRLRIGSFTRLEGLKDVGVAAVFAYNGCEHTLAVSETGQLYSWGYNYRGQLGIGSTASTPYPERVLGLGTGARAVQSVACSYYHTIVTTRSGDVYAFGRNDFGQLGLGDTQDRQKPARVAPLDAAPLAIACGQYHTVVATVRGDVFACGKNDYGQLGLEAPDAQRRLLRVSLREPAAAVACGYYHTLVQSRGPRAQAYGFGRNDYGQLGLGHDRQRVYAPQQITVVPREASGDMGVSRLAAGCYHSLFVVSSCSAEEARVFVCGRNNHGQLGLGDTRERHAPEEVGAKNAFASKDILAIAAGFYHTVILARPRRREGATDALANPPTHPSAALAHAALQPGRGGMEPWALGLAVLAHLDRVALRTSFRLRDVAVIGTGSSGGGAAAVEALHLEAQPRTLELLADVMAKALRCLEARPGERGSDANLPATLLAGVLRLLAANLRHLVARPIAAAVLGALRADNEGVAREEGAQHNEVKPVAPALKRDAKAKKAAAFAIALRRLRAQLLEVMRRAGGATSEADDAADGVALDLAGEAGRALAIGYELFFPAPGERADLLCRLLAPEAATSGEGRRLPWEADRDSAGRLDGAVLVAARPHLLAPLLERLRSEALVARLVPAATASGGHDDFFRLLQLLVARVDGPDALAAEVVGAVLKSIFLSASIAPAALPAPPTLRLPSAALAVWHDEPYEILGELAGSAAPPSPRFCHAVTLASLVLTHGAEALRAALELPLSAAPEALAQPSLQRLLPLLLHLLLPLAEESVLARALAPRMLDVLDAVNDILERFPQGLRGDATMVGVMRESPRRPSLGAAEVVAEPRGEVLRLATVGRQSSDDSSGSEFDRGSLDDTVFARRASDPEVPLIYVEMPAVNASLRRSRTRGPQPELAADATPTPAPQSVFDAVLPIGRTLAVLTARMCGVELRPDTASEARGDDALTPVLLRLRGLSAAPLHTLHVAGFLSYLGATPTPACSVPCLDAACITVQLQTLCGGSRLDALPDASGLAILGRLSEALAADDWRHRMLLRQLHAGGRDFGDATAPASRLGTALLCALARHAGLSPLLARLAPEASHLPPALRRVYRGVARLLARLQSLRAGLMGRGAGAGAFYPDCLAVAKVFVVLRPLGGMHTPLSCVPGATSAPRSAGRFRGVALLVRAAVRWRRLARAPGPEDGDAETCLRQLFEAVHHRQARDDAATGPSVATALVRRLLTAYEVADRRVVSFSRLGALLRSAHAKSATTPVDVMAVVAPLLGGGLGGDPLRGLGLLDGSSAGEVEGQLYELLAFVVERLRGAQRVLGVAQTEPRARSGDVVYVNTDYLHRLLALLTVRFGAGGAGNAGLSFLRRYSVAEVLRNLQCCLWRFLEPQAAPGWGVITATPAKLRAELVTVTKERKRALKKCMLHLWTLLRLVVARFAAAESPPRLPAGGDPLLRILLHELRDLRNKSCDKRGHLRAEVLRCRRLDRAAGVGAGEEDAEIAGPPPGPRRCQELIPARTPRRFLHREDGLVFGGAALGAAGRPGAADFSVLFWVQVTQDATGARRLVLARGLGRELWPAVLLRAADCRLEVGFGVASLGAGLCDWLVSKEPLRLGVWTHVAVVCEASRLSLFVNGRVDAERAHPGVAPPRASRHHLYVGQVPASAPALRLDGCVGGLEGAVAQLRYYTRALSPIHVRIVFDQGLPDVGRVKDRKAFQLCSLLRLLAQSGAYRPALSGPAWLDVLLGLFLRGSRRVVQACARGLETLLLDAGDAALLELAPLRLLQNAGTSPRETLVDYLLGLAGLGLRFDPAIARQLDAEILEGAAPGCLELLPEAFLGAYVHRDPSPYNAHDASSALAIGLSAGRMQEAYVFAMEALSLLRSLDASPAWAEVLQRCCRRALEAPPEAAAEAPVAAEGAEDSAVAPQRRLAASRRVAALALLAGELESLREGVAVVGLANEVVGLVVSLDPVRRTAEVAAAGAPVLDKHLTHALEHLVPLPPAPAAVGPGALATVLDVLATARNDVPPPGPSLDGLLRRADVAQDMGRAAEALYRMSVGPGGARTMLAHHREVLREVLGIAMHHDGAEAHMTLDEALLRRAVARRRLFQVLSCRGSRFGEAAAPQASEPDEDEGDDAGTAFASMQHIESFLRDQYGEGADPGYGTSPRSPSASAVRRLRLAHRLDPALDDDRKDAEENADLSGDADGEAEEASTSSASSDAASSRAEEDDATDAEPGELPEPRLGEDLDEIASDGELDFGFGLQLERRMADWVEGADDREVPTELVEQLMAMGFPEDWCVTALREADLDLVAASAWIVDHLEFLTGVGFGAAAPDLGPPTLDVHAMHDAAPDAAPTGLSDSEDHAFTDGEPTLSPPRPTVSLQEDRGLEPVVAHPFSAAALDEGDRFDDEAGSQRFAEAFFEGADAGAEAVRRDGTDIDARAAVSPAGLGFADAATPGDPAVGYSRDEQYRAFGAPPRRLARSPTANLDATTGIAGAGSEAPGQTDDTAMYRSDLELASLSGSPPTAVLSRIGSLDLGALLGEVAALERTTAVLFLRATLLELLAASDGDGSVLDDLPVAAVLQTVRLSVLRQSQTPCLVNGRQYPAATCSPATTALARLLEGRLAREEQPHPPLTAAQQLQLLAFDGYIENEAADAALASRLDTLEQLKRPLAATLCPPSLRVALLQTLLEDLETAATAPEYAEVPWGRRSLRLGDATAMREPHVELASFLWDLLAKNLTSGPGGVETLMVSVTVARRLARLLLCGNMSVKALAMRFLSEVYRHWTMRLARALPHGVAPSPEARVALLALRKALKNGVSPLRLRCCTARRVDFERRQGRVIHSPYVAALLDLLSSYATAERGLAAAASRDVAVPPRQVQPPELLYAGESSLFLSWRLQLVDAGFLRLASSDAGGVVFELQVRQLDEDADLNDAGWSLVYRGTCAQYQLEGLRPGSVYAARVRLLDAEADDAEADDAEAVGAHAWSISEGLRTKEGLAFVWDRHSSGPDVFVSRDELSATHGGHEQWSTLLGSEGFCTGVNTWEVRLEQTTTSYLFVGVAARAADLASFLGGDDHGWGYIGDRALYHGRSKLKAYGDRFLEGDTISVTLDCDKGTLSFARNGVELGVAFEHLGRGPLYPAVAFYNKGQRVSLRRDAFCCPGAGRRLAAAPDQVTPEDVAALTDTLSCLADRRRLPLDPLRQAYAYLRLWLRGDLWRIVSAAGTQFDVDASPEAFARLGLGMEAVAWRHGDVVRTPRGSARIQGVHLGLGLSADNGGDLLWVSPLHPKSDGPNPSWCFRRQAVAQGLSRGQFRPLRPGSSSGNADEEDDIGFGEFLRLASPDVWSPAMDAELMEAANSKAFEANRGDLGAFNLTPTELLPIIEGLAARRDFADLPPRQVRCRWALLRFVNHAVAAVLPFGDAGPGADPPATTLSGLLGRLKGCILTPTKHALLERALDRSATAAKKADDDYDYPDNLPQLLLNRPRSSLLYAPLDPSIIARFAPGCVAAAAVAPAPPPGAAGREGGLGAGVAPLLAWTRLGLPDGTPADAAACLPLAEHAKLGLSLFGQMETQLSALTPARQRLSYCHPMDDGQRRSFKVKFEGEGVDDYGGPYREIFAQVAAELQATAVAEAAVASPHVAVPLVSPRCVLPLLVPTASALSYSVADDLENASIGTLSGPFVPNPGATAPVLLERFLFLGKLLGIALRSRAHLQLQLPLLVWKQLVGEDVGEADLAEVDPHLVRSLAQMRRLARGGDSAEAEVICDSLRWTATLAHGREVPLGHRDPDDAVRPAELDTYLDCLVDARLHESAPQVRAMRQGLGSIVPAGPVTLLTGVELRQLIQGRQTVDLDLLERNTDYDETLLSGDDEHVQRFWRVLRSFDHAERSQFLRFVWARPQLPADDRSFGQKFKLQPPVGEDAGKEADGQLPKAHTCFFSLNLPRYSSDAVMAERLRYAMTSCVTMDADFRLSDAEMTGWDIDPE